MVSERVARLRVELQELEPKIWQRIDMPLSTTLETRGRLSTHVPDEVDSPGPIVGHQD